MSAKTTKTKSATSAKSAPAKKSNTPAVALKKGNIKPLRPTS